MRTYAQATAGTPLTMRFDHANGDFLFRYRPDRTIDAPTRIFVSPLHYPEGRRVRIQHGRVVNSSPRTLTVEATSRRVVTVRILRATRP